MFSWMAVVFAVLLGTDVICKQQVEENLDPGERRELFGGRVVIRKAYNRGFLLNLLEDRPRLIKGATMITSAGILIWDVLVFLKKGNFPRKLGLTLLSAGAASNTFDRMARGLYRDPEQEAVSCPDHGESWRSLHSVRRNSCYADRPDAKKMNQEALWRK